MGHAPYPIYYNLLLAHKGVVYLCKLQLWALTVSEHEEELRLWLIKALDKEGRSFKLSGAKDESWWNQKVVGAVFYPCSFGL